MTAEGHINEFHAYPAKSETLRGTGSKMKAGTVVLEEAAFINPEVTTSIVAPTLTRDNVRNNTIITCLTNGFFKGELVLHKHN